MYAEGMAENAWSKTGRLGLESSEMSNLITCNFFMIVAGGSLECRKFLVIVEEQCSSVGRMTVKVGRNSFIVLKINNLV